VSSADKSIAPDLRDDTQRFYSAVDLASLPRVREGALIQGTEEDKRSSAASSDAAALSLTQSCGHTKVMGSHPQPLILFWIADVICKHSSDFRLIQNAGAFNRMQPWTQIAQ
jgi:hypothetical protein